MPTATIRFIRAAWARSGTTPTGDRSERERSHPPSTNTIVQRTMLVESAEPASPSGGITPPTPWMSARLPKTFTTIPTNMMVIATRGIDIESRYCRMAVNSSMGRRPGASAAMKAPACFDTSGSCPSASAIFPPRSEMMVTGIARSAASHTPCTSRRRHSARSPAPNAWLTSGPIPITVPDMSIRVTTWIEVPIPAAASAPGPSPATMMVSVVVMAIPPSWLTMMGPASPRSAFSSLRKSSPRRRRPGTGAARKPVLGVAASGGLGIRGRVRVKSARAMRLSSFMKFGQ